MLIKIKKLLTSIMSLFKINRNGSLVNKLKKNNYIFIFSLIILLNFIKILLMQTNNLIFPTDKLKIIEKNGVIYVYDIIRMRFVKCTPEEYVRQALINYLVNDLHYPKELMSIENEIIINKQSRRFDLVIFSRNISPLLLVEVKAPNIPINENVLYQLAQYNYSVKSQYWLLTNGLALYFMKYDNQINKIIIKNELPKWEDLK